MKLQPLKQWICDGCGKIIKDIEDGYIEYIEGVEGNHYKAKDFRIVHHASKSPKKPDGNCYKYEKTGTWNTIALSEFVGNNGLAQLLTLIDIGPIHSPQFSGPHVQDLREWTDFCRRLHFPYYEEARLHWENAQADGYFDGKNEVAIYLPETLKALINIYEARNE
ncbi:MAG: hypothetical protein AAB019_08300 [Planctomycetota bacterium]